MGETEMSNRKKTWVSLMSTFILATSCATVQTTSDTGSADRSAAMGITQATEEGDRDGEAMTDAARDPRAEEMILDLTRHAKERRIFRFEFEDTFDDVRPDGPKVQLTHVRQGVVSRPNMFRIETTGDVANRVIVKNDKTVTLWDRDENVYAQVAESGSIDDALDMLMARYQVAVPAADLFYEDPAQSFMEQMRTAEYVGLSEADGIACHHLLFTGETFDWQVWIEAGDRPALRKLAIDYKMLPGRPQYMLRIISVETLTSVEPGEFDFEAPADAEKIEMLPVPEAEKQ
jgi:hypothetical protein